jgi:hypothetical protein
MIGYEYEYENIVNDLLAKGLYKENIGRWIAAVGEDYVIADSGKEAFDKIRKKYRGAEPFVFKIFAPDKSVIMIAAA